MGTEHGACFGKYQTLAEIGRGGMSRVYLAVARGPGGFSKLVVVKQLSTELRQDQSYVQMFLDEARLAARLNHPNIVQTNEVDHQGEEHYLVMEYLDGQTFASILRRVREGGGLPLELTVKIVAEAAAGLDYAHTLLDFDGTPLGIVHRDISPQNIFVTYGGQVKIVDFGIAKTANPSIKTEAGVLKGKLAYMAPEQAQGLAVDGRADVFALGVVLHEALVGRRIRDIDDINILRELLANKPIPSPLTLRPDVPEPLVDICQRALEMDPAKRFASALDLGRELENFLGGLTNRVSSHALGEFVGNLFSEKRSEITRIIDGQLKAVEGLPSGEPLSATLPTLKLSGVAQTPSRSQLDASPDKDSASIAVASPPSTMRAQEEAPTPRPKWMTLGAVALLIVLSSAITWLGTRRTSSPATFEPRLTASAGSSTADAAIAPAASAKKPETLPLEPEPKEALPSAEASAHPTANATPVSSAHALAPRPKAAVAPVRKEDAPPVDPLGDRK